MLLLCNPAEAPDTGLVNAGRLTEGKVVEEHPTGFEIKVFFAEVFKNYTKKFKSNQGHSLNQNLTQNLSKSKS